MGGGAGGGAGGSGGTAGGARGRAPGRRRSGRAAGGRTEEREEARAAAGGAGRRGLGMGGGGRAAGGAGGPREEREGHGRKDGGREERPEELEDGRLAHGRKDGGREERPEELEDGRLAHGGRTEDGRNGRRSSRTGAWPAGGAGGPREEGRTEDGRNGRRSWRTEERPEELEDVRLAGSLAAGGGPAIPLPRHGPPRRGKGGQPSRGRGQRGGLRSWWKTSRTCEPSASSSRSARSKGRAPGQTSVAAGQVPPLTMRLPLWRPLRYDGCVALTLVVWVEGREAARFPDITSEEVDDAVHELQRLFPGSRVLIEETRWAGAPKDVSARSGSSPPQAAELPVDTRSRGWAPRTLARGADPVRLERRSSPLMRGATRGRGRRPPRTPSSLTTFSLIAINVPRRSRPIVSRRWSLPRAR